MWRGWHHILCINIVSDSTGFNNARVHISSTFLPVTLSVYLCVPQTWRGLRMAVWECLNGTDRSSSFVSDKQATLVSPGSILTPKAIRYTNTERERACRLCFVCLLGCSDYSEFWLQCGVADGEGFLSLWQVNQTASNPKPYLVSSTPHPHITLLQTKQPSLSQSWNAFFILLLCCRQSWQCHSKTCGDFAFITSSSLIATAGQSNDNRWASATRN